MAAHVSLIIVTRLKRRVIEADLQNMDYMKDSYPSIDYDSPHSRSRENLASPRYPYSGSRENIANPSNRLNRSRENIADHGYP
jgi:hypothetical protein